MIPKKLKYTMTITLLALGTACLATGCKKKHDKIDLSGNQAAESSVQTAPAATTVSGEGNSENKTGQEITIEPAIEMPQASLRALPPVVRPQPLPCQSKQEPTGTGMFPFNTRSFRTPQ